MSISAVILKIYSHTILSLKNKKQAASLQFNHIPFKLKKKTNMRLYKILFEARDNVTVENVLQGLEKSTVFSCKDRDALEELKFKGCFYNVKSKPYKC